MQVCVCGCDLLVSVRVRVRVRVGVAVRSKQMSSECVEKAGKVQPVQPLLLRLPRSCHSTSVRVVMLMLLLTLALCHGAEAKRTRAPAARRELFITLQ